MRLCENDMQILLRQLESVGKKKQVQLVKSR